MARDRQLPPAPFGPDGPYLSAILTVLDEIADTVAEIRDQQSGGRNVEPEGDAEPVAEPTEPVMATPRKVQEPAPALPPLPEDGEGGGTVDAEPAPTAPHPPRAGRGSSAEAWRAWATNAGVALVGVDTRDDIIAACELAGVLEPS